EKRLREVTEESEVGRAQMVSLQQQFSRMEETVRSLLQNQGVGEQTAVDTVDIMKAYKVNNNPITARFVLCCVDPECVFVCSLQEKNSALASENKSQREQYERCLDEVTFYLTLPVLLFTQDLREECLKLRTRVFDLEQQNRALGVLFQQRIKPASDLLLQVCCPLRTQHTEVQLNGKAGLPVTKCLSQLSLTAPAPVYPRSSCSSSELSLSSACSEFSSGSYTWNDGRSLAHQDPCFCSGCQMRTLDSGIGTFPLPDSVTRASGRHIPKSESSPDGVTACSSDLDREPPSSYPDPSQPDVKVDNTQDTQSRLPKLAASGKSRNSLYKLLSCKMAKCQSLKTYHSFSLSEGNVYTSCPRGELTDAIR
uniref:NCK associated protein 5 n=1 Tax=Sander lucioperca TaxID=283035 RepID=A0A8D0DF44_SANLU